jgi:hypothetical protein
MGQVIDLRGQVFGRLVVVERAGSDAGGNARWTCRCECGTDKVATGRALQAKDPRKRTYSCGCLQREAGRAQAIRNIRHGASARGASGKERWPEYWVWSIMKDRCLNANNAKFKDYGGRGIKVCDRWLGDDGFTNFIADMGRRPSPEHSIDRIENDGNYEPGNCRWATRSQQQRNTRRQDYALNPLPGI